MYENVINQLKFYIQQKETTMQLTVGRMVAPALKKEINTLHSAVEAIEALVAGQETLQSGFSGENKQVLTDFIAFLKSKAGLTYMEIGNGIVIPGSESYVFTEKTFNKCLEDYLKEGSDDEVPE